jgi:hypothetical protein
MRDVASRDGNPMSALSPALGPQAWGFHILRMVHFNHARGLRRD